MKRPSKIRISPHDFEIRVDDKIADVAQVTGACQEDAQFIILGTGLGSTVEKETVLHEAGHAMWHQTDLDRQLSDEVEEAVLWTLMPRMLALLRDNPKLVEWLCE